MSVLNWGLRTVWKEQDHSLIQCMEQIIKIFVSGCGQRMCIHAQSCPVLCDPMDCSPPGSSVHGLLQARIPEWAAMPSSRGSSQPRDQTQVSCTGKWIFTTEPPGSPVAATVIRNYRMLILNMFPWIPDPVILSQGLLTAQVIRKW